MLNSHNTSYENPTSKENYNTLPQPQGLWEIHLPVFSCVHELPGVQGIKFLVPVSILNLALIWGQKKLEAMHPKNEKHTCCV